MNSKMNDQRFADKRFIHISTDSEQ